MSNKVEKSGLVPKLRFPEFLEAGAWKTETLGSVATISAEKVGDQTCIPMSITSGVGLVSQQDKFGRIIAGSSYKNYLQLKQNDFAYNKSATKEYPEGYLALYSGEALAAVPNSIFTCFRINGNSPAPKYLDYLFHGNLHGKWLRKFIQVGARAHGSLSINDSDLLALPVPLPEGPLSLTEQQKIAGCLASLDEMITLEAQKLDTLKTHKKGLMQQLFPAEGVTLPKLRFPEFRDAGEWEAKRLEDFAVIVRGGSPRPIDEYITNDPNGLNWLKIGDIDKESKYVTRTQDKVIPAALNKSRVVSPGDLILSNSMSFGRPYILEIKTCIHDGWIAVSEINNSLDRDYLYYLMMTSASQKYFSNNAAGSGVQNLNADIIKVLPVSYPSKKEQQKIANCLASLDDLITAQTQKLAALKTHKKGLMQQLFPVLDEVSA